MAKKRRVTVTLDEVGDRTVCRLLDQIDERDWAKLLKHFQTLGAHQFVCVEQFIAGKPPIAATEEVEAAKIDLAGALD